MSDSLLLQRLHEIHGEEWISFHDSPDDLKVLQGSGRIRVIRMDDGELKVIRDEPTPAASMKHKEIKFHMYPVNKLVSVTMLPELKDVHPDIDSFIIINNTVKTFTEDKKLLLTWKLDDNWDLLPPSEAVVRSIASKRRTTLTECPYIFGEWCKRHFPTVCFVNACINEGRQTWMIFGSNEDETQFKIEGKFGPDAIKYVAAYEHRKRASPSCVCDRE